MSVNPFDQIHLYAQFDPALETAYKRECEERFNAALHGDDDEFEELLLDSIQVAADGCTVEPDGICEHGYRSPMLLLGII